MVKQGFLNLSTVEQGRVIEAALDEFSSKSFESASINQIIQNAGISKGSLYHYFHNKEDLFVYLIELVMEEKKELAELGRPLHELNFFETMAMQLKVSAKFGRQNPRYHLITMQLQNMPDNRLKQKIWGRFDTEFEKFMITMVNGAVETGELRSDFDRQFIMRLLKFVLLNFTQIFPDVRDLENICVEALEKEVSQLVEFLKSGLQEQD